MKKKQMMISIAIGVLVFAAVFALTFFMKSKPAPATGDLTQLSQKMNDLGYVGAELLFCMDDNRCPENYDPQSAMGLMPFVKNMEDGLFSQLKVATENAPNLAGLLEQVGQCRNYCSCAVWSRFLASEHGVSFDLDLNLSPNEKVECPGWAELPPDRLQRADDLMREIEGLQTNE